jgi:hypothetical protein
MPAITKPLMLGDVNFDDPAERDEFFARILAKGRIRVQADISKLQAMGVMDANGKLLITEDHGTAPDMQEGSERDFGG